MKGEEAAGVQSAILDSTKAMETSSKWRIASIEQIARDLHGYLHAPSLSPAPGAKQ